MTDTLHGLTRGCPSLQLAHAQISHHAGSHLTNWTLSEQEYHLSALEIVYGAAAAAGLPCAYERQQG